MSSVVTRAGFRRAVLARIAVSCAGAFLAVSGLPAPDALAQTTRSITIVQTRAGVPFPHPGWATWSVRQTTTITAIEQRVPDVARRAVIGGVVPVDQLTAVAGIRRTPVAPPTVYRIEGPRTAMHKADEERLRQVNPGARVITPDDLTVSPQMRRRYAIPPEGRAPEMRRPRVAASQGVIMPQVIIVRPSGTY